MDTTGTVLLGLTIGCATCHDHKFDPIAQKDFYSMAAFFRNTTQAALDGNIAETPPIIVVPKDEDRAQWLKLTNDAESVKNRMADARKSPNGGFDGWLNSKPAPAG